MLQNGGAIEEKSFYISTIIRFANKETFFCLHNNLESETKNIFTTSVTVISFGQPLLLCLSY